MDFLTEASWQDGAFSDRGPSVEAFAGSTGWDTAAWTWTWVWGSLLAGANCEVLCGSCQKGLCWPGSCSCSCRKDSCSSEVPEGD